MISRIWHGWTTPENADAYEKLLRHEIIEGFIDRKIEGFRRMHILRRARGKKQPESKTKRKPMAIPRTTKRRKNDAKILIRNGNGEE